MTHGHELKGGNAGGRACAGQRGIKGEKWDNSNSIIDRIIIIIIIIMLTFCIYRRKKEELCNYNIGKITSAK